MDGAGSTEHRERARRAQQLSDRASERAYGEREAAERSERVMAEAADPALADLHRQAAERRHEAWQLYEKAAHLQQSHAEHERHAAQRAEELQSRGGDRDLRDLQ